MKARHHKVFVILLGLALVIGACSQDSDDGSADTTATTAGDATTTTGEGSDTTSGSETMAPFGTLDVGWPTLGAFTCHPRLTTSADQGRALASIFAYEPLVTQDESGEFVGVLAESWSVADNQTTWTFKLREGVQFHQGYGELTADDVVYSLEQHAAEDSVNGNAGSLRRLFAGGIRAVDDYTVEIDTGTPQIDLLNFLRGPIAGTAYIISKDQVDEVGEDALAEVGCAGTGPWEFSEASPSEWHFTAVEDHYRKTPEWAELVYHELPEEATRVANFQAGEIDTMVASPDSLAALMEVDGAELMTPATGVDFHLGMYGNYYVKQDEWPGYDPSLPWVSGDPNVDSEEWQQAAKVREAMAIAIDRETIVSELLGNAGDTTAVWGWGPTKGLLPAEVEWEFNPDRAIELLAEAGYPDGFDVVLDVRIAGAPAEVEACEAIATMWTNIGLNVEFRNQPGDAIRDGLLDRSHNTPVCQAVGDVPEPINQYVNWVPSEAVFSGGIEHPVLDELVALATQTFDKDERLEIEKEMAQFTFDNALDIGVYRAFVQWPLGPELGSWAENWRYGDGRLLSSLEYATHKDS